MRRSVAEFTAVIGGLSAAQCLPDKPAQAGRRAIPLWLALTGGSVTRRQLSRYSTVTDETLSRDLRRLAELHLLERVGRGRGAHYIPGPVAAAWGDFSELTRAAMDDGMEGVATLLSQNPATLFD